MREVMIVLAMTAICGFSTPARAQEAAAAQGGASTQPKASPKVQAQLKRAYALRAAKKNVEALAAFKAVLAGDPQNQAALVETGYVYAGMKQWKSAVKYLGQASAQDLSNARLHMDLGYAQQSLKDFDAAGNEFQIVAKESGEFQEQAQKALEALKGAQDGAAAADAAKQNRTLEAGYAALKRGDKAGARAKFAAVVAADGKNTAALKQLGFVNLEEGKVTEAAANFEAARAVEPNDYFLALQLGYTYERLQKKEQAHDAFNAASASSDPKIHDAAVAALKPAAGQTAPSSL
jgi:tetratricopeptide (TPR) repeat protein